MAPASPRLGWAVATLGLRPGARVLEIGCGHGVAAGLAAAAVGPAGHVLAIDRSPVMADAARRRNEAAVAAGVVRVLAVALEDAELPPAAVDRALAVHVDLVRGDGSPGLGRVRDSLAPGGRLHLVMHPPVPGGVEDFVARAAAVLPGHGLRVREVLRRRIGASEAVCVVADAAPASSPPPAGPMRSA